MDIFNQKPELNITPLVDVMLVLLVILMITTPVMEYEEDISLPKGSKSKSRDAEQKIILIKIKSNREVLVNGKGYLISHFADTFTLLTKSYDHNTPIHIKADKSLRYEDVIFILKSVKESGFYKVSLVTDG
jgi:biopolymer transport protein ExbD